MSEECPCCGWLAFEGEVSDGADLLCGCAGQVSVCSEAGAYVVIGDEPCPPTARCRRDRDKAERERDEALRERDAARRQVREIVYATEYGEAVSRKMWLRLAQECVEWGIADDDDAKRWGFEREEGDDA